MGQAKLWWYTAATGEEGHSKVDGIPVEPYVDRDQVATSTTASSSKKSPPLTHLVRIEVDVSTRVRIVLKGETGVADLNDPQIMPGYQGGVGVGCWFACPPESVVSLIEAV